MSVEFDQLLAKETGGQHFGGAGSVAGPNEPTTSPKGAIGIAQVMPATAKDVVTKMMGMSWTPDVEAKYKSDPAFNKQIGETYFNHLKTRYNDDVLATAAYNAGPGSVDKWLQQFGDPRSGALSHEQWTASIPFKETRDYVLGIVGGRSDRLPSIPTPATGNSPTLNYDLATPVDPSSNPVVGVPFTDKQWRAVANPEQPQFSTSAALAAVYEETQTASSVTSYLGKDWEFYQPEGGWTTDLVKQATSDIPEQFWPQVMEAPNPFYERQAILHQLDNVQKMQSLGWGAVPAAMISSLFDPATLAIGYATGGIGAGALAAKRGWLTARLMQAAAAGAGGVAQEALIQATKPVSQWDQVLYSGLAASSLGFALGPSRSSVLAAENQELAKMATKYADMVANRQEPDVFGKSSGGAAQTSFPNDLRTDTPNMVGANDPGDTFGGGLRIDATGQMRNSPNPLVRELGNQLGVDAVGNADLGKLGQTIVASEKQNHLERQMVVDWSTTLEKSLSDYFKRNNIKLWEPWARRDAYNKLSADAFDLIAGLKTADQVDPASAAMAAKAKRIYEDFLTTARDPSSFLGRNRPSLPGFENVADNGNYVPFMHDMRKWREADVKYGSNAMEAFVTDGIRKAMPEMEEAVAKRVAKGYLKTLHQVEAGMDTTYATALMGADRDRLAELLKDADVPAKDITDLLEILKPKKEPVATSRAKARTPIEPSHSARLYNKETGEYDTVGFTDFLIKDMDHLVRSYTRNMSGAIALHGVEIRDADGNILVDGLSRKSDLNKLIQQVRDTSRNLQNRGETILPSQIERDVENLQYFWDAIKGIPIKGSNTKAMMAFNTFKNLNFFRLMGNLGFAQVAEAGSVIYTMGWKAALHNMPVLRKFIQDVKSGDIDKAAADEMSYAFGIGMENSRHGSVHAWDDLGPLDGLYGRDGYWDGFWQKAQMGSTRLAQGLNKASLAPNVTNALQRWAGRGIYYKIGQWVRKPETADTQLMRFMGIDDKMFKRIQAQRSKFDEGSRGELVFNFERWTDREAAAYLQTGILRMVRKTIQENDIGMMNRWFRNNPMLARLIMQFRTFSVGAWSNHTLHQLNRAANKGWLYGSLHMANTVSVGMMVAAIPYIVSTYGKSLGRSDREKFLEERLSPSAIGKAAFQNSSISSFIPMIADAPSGFGLYDPIFSYRNSGMNADPISGSPIGGLYSDTRDSVKAIVNASTGVDGFSQRDARRLGGLFLPNILPVTILYNSMISGLPEKDRSNR